MKVLENHFGGDPTIFINGRIINGCQNFTLDEAPAVFSEFDVSAEMQQDVYDNYVETSTDDEVLEYLNSPDYTIRQAIAEQGFALETLVNDVDWGVRKAVAEHGYGLDKLLNDEEWQVREAVAQQGYGLDVLANDKDWFVREIAKNKGKNNEST